MLNGNNHNSCEFFAEIVSYLYNETGREQRSKFEEHLVDCGACTDEFAAISNARFSVFEWQREEFANMPTPEIVIPYTVRKVADDRVGTIGFLSALGKMLSFGSRASLALAFAAILICIGLVV